MITEMGRDLQNIDDDILFAKRVIKEKLCKDSDVIKYLNNKELEKVDAEPDDYFGVNIFPFIRIPGTLDKVKNFICFSVDGHKKCRIDRGDNIAQTAHPCCTDTVALGNGTFGIEQKFPAGKFQPDRFA